MFFLGCKEDGTRMLCEKYSAVAVAFAAAKPIFKVVDAVAHFLHCSIVRFGHAWGQHKRWRARPERRTQQNFDKRLLGSDTYSKHAKLFS